MDDTDASEGGSAHWPLRPWGQRRARWVILGGVALALVVLLLWKVPQWQAAGVQSTAADPNARITVENELRRTMATVLAGAFVLVSGGLAWLNIRIAQDNLKVTQQNLVVSQEGQITDRFTKAIEQLGATHPDGRPHLELRLGGIYALERIAQDSPARDHGPIMEVLTAYVRENAPVSDADDEAVSSEEPGLLRKPRADVQAVLTVLGRRSGAQRKCERQPLDLSGSRLRGAILVRAHLGGAYLMGSDLVEAYLSEADLRGAAITGAHLDGAHLERAHLEGAYLAETSLEGAILVEAHLEGAYLAGTYLERANLEGASLVSAFLEGAHLEGARLAGTDLSQVTGLTRAQLDEADIDDATVLPRKLVPQWTAVAVIPGIAPTPGR